MSERWSSNLAFWVALISSAVGLGNIWRFAYLLSEYGVAFLGFYLLGLFAVGLPLLCIELVLAKRKKAPVRRLFESKGGYWKHWPILIFLLFFTLGSYYGVVVAQTLEYAIGIHMPAAIFLVWAATVFIVFKGVSGIENANNILMMVLVAMLLALFFSSNPDITKLVAIDSEKGLLETMFAAIGQVLFSLSVGAGMTYTYGSYAGKKFNVVKTAVVVALADAGIALLSSSIIFSLPYEESMFVAFESLHQTVMAHFGSIGNLLLFTALFSAGLTSLIAIVKVIADNWGKKFVFLQMVASVVLGLLLPGLIQPLDQYVVTYLFITMLPVNAYFFYRLAVHRARSPERGSEARI